MWSEKCASEVKTTFWINFNQDKSFSTSIAKKFLRVSMSSKEISPVQIRKYPFHPHPVRWSNLMSRNFQEIRFRLSLKEIFKGAQDKCKKRRKIKILLAVSPTLKSSSGWLTPHVHMFTHSDSFTILRWNFITSRDWILKKSLYK